VIAIEDATYRYGPGDEPAVRDVSVSVAPGEMVGIVGPNGSGKSTLSRLMKGLIVPEAGRVTVDGRDTRDDALGVRRLVGLVFQNPDSQIVNSVVEDEVAFGPENLGLPASEIRRRVDQALDTVGLRGRERAESHAQSMADKQRIALAAVLAMEPRYLILDEPTAWMEPAKRTHLLERIREWQQETGGGLVVVTHRMDEARACDRLYGMLHGRVDVEGFPDRVLGDAEVRRRLALDVPEAYALAESLRAAGLPVQPGQSVDVLAEELCPS